MCSYLCDAHGFGKSGTSVRQAAIRRISGIYDRRWIRSIQEPIRFSLQYIAAFLTQTVKVEDGSNVKFEIWYVLSRLIGPLANTFGRDTAGQERYKVSYHFHLLVRNL